MYKAQGGGLCSQEGRTGPAVGSLASSRYYSSDARGHTSPRSPGIWTAWGGSLHWRGSWRIEREAPAPQVSVLEPPCHPGPRTFG